MGALAAQFGYVTTYFIVNVALPVCSTAPATLPGGGGVPGGAWATSCAPLSWTPAATASGGGVLVASCSNGVNNKVVGTMNTSLCAPGSGIINSNGLLTWWGIGGMALMQLMG